MSIDVVFLATMIGNVEHTVYIYTSKGNFPYQVNVLENQVISIQLLDNLFSLEAF